MSLWTEVQARYDEQSLIELSNPRDAGATTLGDTKGNRAASSVEHFFKLYGQLDYDSTDELHVEVGCEGVIALLFRWGGTSNAIGRIEFDAWVERLKALKGVDPRSHVKPQTSSRLTPSVEAESGQTLRPSFDRDHFNRTRLNPPGGGSAPGIMP